MSQISDIITKVSQAFSAGLRNHKLKFFSVFLFASIFFAMLFPIKDLSTAISNSVNQISPTAFLDFSDLSLQIVPGQGFQLSDVLFYSTTTGLMQMRELSVSTSLFSLVTQKLQINASAKNLFAGSASVQASVSPFPVFALALGDDPPQVALEETMANGDVEYKVEAIESSLDQLFVQFGLPLKAKGRVTLVSDGKVALGFSTPPDVKFLATFSNFQLESGSIDTQMGQISTPALNIGTLVIEGHLAENNLTIQKFSGGTKEGDLFLKIEGDVGINLSRSPQGLVGFAIGGYNLKTQLSIEANKAQELFLVLALLEPYVKENQGRKEYSVSLRGTSMYTPPTIRPL